MVNCKYEAELINTAKNIATPGKGILAADESTNTIGKRFHDIKIENTHDNRRHYRTLLFSTPNLSKYISGVILTEETLYQENDGVLVVQPLKDSGIYLGIKVDMGTRPLPFTNGDTFTQGLDSLSDRCAKYYESGCRFAKWRAVLKIQNNQISEESIRETAYTLARYAATCQLNGLVPIVEPEILMDGDHSLETCEKWTQKVINACYYELTLHNVLIKGTLLKPNMCLPGKDNKCARSFVSNAAATINALNASVVPAVPGIMFLSGGQSEVEATLNLNELNKTNHPWYLSFSFGRALQRSALHAWKGEKENVKVAQDLLFGRAKANSEATFGKYLGDAKGSQESLFQEGYTY